MENSTIPVNKKEENPVKRPANAVSLRSKEFVERNCLLDGFMKNEEGLLVFRIFAFILLGLVAQTAVYDYIHKGEVNLGQRLILIGLTNFHRFWFAWIALFSSNFLVYYAFKYWATVRTGLAPKSPSVRYWDQLWLGLTVLYYPLYLYLATWISLQQGLKTLLIITILCEILRMLMKQHAFLRSNVPKVLNYKPHSENEVFCPNLSYWMYFLWAPTAVYKDSYPRTKSIRWSYVGFKAGSFVTLLFFMSVVIERYFIHTFKDYGIKSYSWSEIVAMIIENAAGGMLIMACLFYMAMDKWMCAFAEICTFGDRQFYQDWWASISYDRYHRTWNIVIHDWLYTYVYADMYKFILPGNKIAAKYAVFFLSAVFHEYVLALAFGFFMPIVFIQFFIFGSFVAFPKIKSEYLSNALFVYTLGLGNSINASFYAMEYFARLNCPVEDATLANFFKPRMFSCKGT